VTGCVAAERAVVTAGVAVSAMVFVAGRAADEVANEVVDEVADEAGGAITGGAVARVVRSGDDGRIAVLSTTSAGGAVVSYRSRPFKGGIRTTNTSRRDDEPQLLVNAAKCPS